MADKNERFVVVEQTKPTHFVTDNKTILPLKWEVIDRGEDFYLYMPNCDWKVIARFATEEEAGNLKRALLSKPLPPLPIEKVQELLDAHLLDHEKVKVDIVSDGIDAFDFAYYLFAGYNKDRMRCLFAVCVDKDKVDGGFKELYRLIRN